MTEDLHEIIKTIKKEFRLSMNGVVSTLQRRQGLDYKINFGVEIPRLKDIAAKYQKNKELAQIKKAFLYNVFCGKYKFHYYFSSNTILLIAFI